MTDTTAPMTPSVGQPAAADPLEELFHSMWLLGPEPVARRAAEAIDRLIDAKLAELVGGNGKVLATFVPFDRRTPADEQLEQSISRQVSDLIAQAAQAAPPAAAEGTP